MILFSGAIVCVIVERLDKGVLCCCFIFHKDRPFLAYIY